MNRTLSFIRNAHSEYVGDFTPAAPKGLCGEYRSCSVCRHTKCLYNIAWNEWWFLPEWAVDTCDVGQSRQQLVLDVRAYLNSLCDPDAPIVYEEVLK